MMSTTPYADLSKKFVFNIGGKKQSRQHAGGTSSGNGCPTGFQVEILAEHCRELAKRWTG
jgi:hypothetical protein